MVKWITIALALLGLGLGIYTVATSDRMMGEPEPAAPPTVNPYAQAVAASGLVEAASRNIAIGVPEPGLVTAVYVDATDAVEAGARLFQLDPRPLEAELVQARAAVRVAEAELAQLEAAPRPEALPILEAEVDAAEAEADLARQQFERARRLVEEQAIPREQFDQRRAEWQAAAAQLARAQAVLAEQQAGTWERQLEVARAQLRQTEAQVRALALRLERLTVRAPIAGTILKRRIEPGESVAMGGAANSAMVLGDLSRYRVRAQVDEQDVSLVPVDAPAVARLRGERDVSLPLRMVRIEPLAEPKRQLTGVPTELVDTRVVDVIFEVVDTQGVPIYPGQIVDVFIDRRQ